MRGFFHLSTLISSDYYVRSNRHFPHRYILANLIVTKSGIRLRNTGHRIDANRSLGNRIGTVVAFVDSSFPPTSIFSFRYDAQIIVF